MSCGCENKEIMKERERMRELAKKSSSLDECVYILYLKADNTFGFCKEAEFINQGQLIEYIGYGR